MPLHIDPADTELNTIRRMVDIAARRVVEIGTGDGRLAWPLAQEAAAWVALDSEGEYLKSAAAEARNGAGPHVLLAQADGRALCLPAAAFDLALFSWSLC